MFCMVGLNNLDVVNFLPSYPLEDSDHRCTKQTWERGGNASNNASVLRELGAEVEYFGTLANDRMLSFFQDDMKSSGIKYENCPIMDNFQCPASVVICSEETGSRTIVHHNGGLPELTLEQFQQKLDLKNYSWIHFEGRNIAELKKILNYVQQYNQDNVISPDNAAKTGDLNYQKHVLPISLEIEKSRPELGELLQLADVVFIGKEFSVMNGATDCIHAGQIFSQLLPKGVLIICPWGDQGASFCTGGCDKTTEIKKVNAISPGKIIDSLGAGDTFLASVIYALRKNLDIETSVKFGCKIAAKKLSICGFRGIKDLAKHEPELI